MVIELRVVQFWSETILVISNRTRAKGSFDFEIMRMISDQIALNSFQLPLFIVVISSQRFTERLLVNSQMGEQSLQLGDDLFSKAQQ